MILCSTPIASFTSTWPSTGCVGQSSCLFLTTANAFYVNLAVDGADSSFPPTWAQMNRRRPRDSPSSVEHSPSPWSTCSTSPQTQRSRLVVQGRVFDRRLVKVKARIPSRFRKRPLERAAADDGLPIDLVRRRERRSPRRKRQTLEDPTRHAGIRDGGDQSHPSPAARTTKRIDLEDALQQIRPRDATSKRFASLAGRRGTRTSHARLAVSRVALPSLVASSGFAPRRLPIGSRIPRMRSRRL